MRIDGRIDADDRRQSDEDKEEGGHENDAVLYVPARIVLHGETAVGIDGDLCFVSINKCVVAHDVAWEL